MSVPFLQLWVWHLFQKLLHSLLWRRWTITVIATCSSHHQVVTTALLHILEKMLLSWNKKVFFGDMSPKWSVGWSMAKVSKRSDIRSTIDSSKNHRTSKWTNTDNVSTNQNHQGSFPKPLTKFQKIIFWRCTDQNHLCKTIFSPIILLFVSCSFVIWICQGVSARNL